MKDSIIVDMKYADCDLIEGTPCVARHHVLHGTANRDCADKDGLWVGLTPKHHTDSKCSAHQCHIMDVLLEIIGQLAYEKHEVAGGMSEEDAREAFRRRYGKSFL